ncbi:MAG TPA: adenylosuccinate lyase [Stellaceae bacterium]|nr:adenylosuccinate lyase [Stellaceae bacterium]
MPSGVFDSILLKNSWSTEELRGVFSDENRVQKWYDIEATLASEQAAFGIVPREAAGEIMRKAKIANVDLAEIARAMADAKHPLVPALRALQKLCKPELGEWLHYGPTTQDILDTGMVLQLKESHAITLRDLRAVGRVLYGLAERHRATPMAGRTHGVQALPITFGHKCAIWLREMSRHRERLAEVEKRVFVGCLVGAVGTMASFGPKAVELEAGVMKRLGLAQADISWHPARDRFAEYASILGLVAGTLTKIANEVSHLQATEVDEVEEPFNPGKVGSSTMPHKRNPSLCETMITVGSTLRYDVAIMQEALVQTHERSSAIWKMEWKALPEICMGLGLMLSIGRNVLEHLVVKPARMRENLDCLGGLLLSERVMFFLGEKLGKQTAHEVVYEAAMAAQEQGLTLEAALARDVRVTSVATSAELAGILDPTTYVGLAPELVDRALARTTAEGWLS